MILVRLLAVLGLVGVNAFFAATEFALVATRTSRIRQLVQKGNPNAKIVVGLLAHLQRVVSGVQVGITLTTLGLGFIGEVSIARAIEPLMSWVPGQHAAFVAHAIALVIAYVLLTTFHVVLGELVPKGLSLHRAERVALLVARPFQWYLSAFRWAISLLDGMAQVVIRAMGVNPKLSHTMVHSAEELQILIQQARERGLLGVREEKFVQGALELGQLQVREIMVPRPDVHALPATATLGDAIELFARTQRSRIPVYQNTLDHVIGFIHIKDVFGIVVDQQRRAEQGKPALPFDLRRLLREPIFVPETKLASEVLGELRQKGVGIALVVDEFGSILGIVTLEDALEQVVGEIHDEFDLVEPAQLLADGSMVLDASLNVRDLLMQYKIELPEDPAYSTVGGFVLAQLGFIPKGGESFDFDGWRFTVVEMDRRRIARLKVQKLPETSAHGEIHEPAPGSQAAEQKDRGAPAAMSHRPS